MSVDELDTVCRSLLQENDYWLLAPLVDNSYEEGIRAPSFQRTVTAWREAGLDSRMADTLALGINGNLEHEISTLPSVVRGSVCRQQSQCPDISFKTAAGETYVESKLVFDCTLDNYYRSIPDDGRKLQKFKGLNRTLLQVVFFVQLPNHDYPAGIWSGSNERGSARKRYLKKPGIDRQYREVVAHMERQPVQPLYRRTLAFPTETVDGALIQRFFSIALRPYDPMWSINADQTFRDAAVGFAIWQC